MNMRRCLAVAALLGIVLPAGTALAQFPIASPGTECLTVTVTSADTIIAAYQGNSAVYSNDLYLMLDSLGIPGNDGILSNDRFIFNNHESTVGSMVSLGTFPIGTELEFRLHVRDTGTDFYTGAATRNPDSSCHARVQGDWTPGVSLVSFEDLLGGPFEYNDLSFSFTHTGSGDRAPVVTAPLAINGEEGGDVSFVVTASDPDSDPISSLSANSAALPAGNDATFVPNGDNTAGTFHWNMRPGNAGSYNVIFTATANALSTSATTQINVRPAGTSTTAEFAWTPRAGDEGIYHITVYATDETGTDSLGTTITVVSPILSSTPIAPLALRAAGAALAPQAIQKGPIISGTTTISGSPGTTVTGTYSASTAPLASALAAAPLRLSASLVQVAPTLTANLSGLPASNNATFVVDNQPVVTAPATLSADAGVPLTVVVGATDPDGDAIDSFTADLSALPAANPGSFSANAENTSGTLTWTPRLEDVGTYAVRFTAFNRLVGVASTTITVRGAAAARVWVAEPVNINIGSNVATHCVEIEPVSGDFDLIAIDLTTVKMVSPGTGIVSEISAVTRQAIVGDQDGNLIQDLRVCFGKEDLRALFSYLTKKTTVPVTVHGRLTSGAYFTGIVQAVVIANGPAVGSASVSPNPLNPQAKLSLVLGKGGLLKVALYDLQGRLVRELANETNALPGPRDITIDGKDSKGMPLASGVYYYRVESADGIHNGRLAIVR